MPAEKKLSGDAIFTIAAVVIGIAFVAWIALAPKPAKSNRELLAECTTDMATTDHIHPNLYITINGEERTIPANIGITSGCMKSIHTHDATGKIHVESPVKRDFILDDFFYVWENTFNKDELMGFHANEDHEVTMFVNGQ